MKTKFVIPVFLLVFFAFCFADQREVKTVSAQISNSQCNAPVNKIVAENCKEGTSDWHMENLQGDIEGFASTTSLTPGEAIDFYINTSAKDFTLKIYRSGYYGGTGGRLIYSAEKLPGAVQPKCSLDRELGLVNCANWKKSYTLNIPEDWVSGVYIAKMIRPDTGGENYIIFVVREKAPKSDIVMQLSVTTYQAYNFYGNKSLYSSLSFDYCPTVSQAPRAVAVSFDRPNSLGAIFQNTYFWTDYPMVYWLEAQGYDVGYITNIDTHHYGTKGNSNDLLKHRIFLSVGHDEYWSQEMRDAVTNARDQGVHLGFFSSNVSYWRIRLESSSQTNVADRTEIDYKTTESGPSDPSGQATTTWRDPAGANHPENAVVGIEYIGDNDTHYFPLQVTTEQAKDKLYRNTLLQTMPSDSFARIGKHLIGWEWDAVVNNGLTPDSLKTLAESPTSGSLLLDAGRKYNYGTAMSNVTRYVTPKGAIVFAAGTNQWSWGLAVYEPNPIIQQITYNLFSDMGVQPASPASTLILDKSGTKGESIPLITSQISDWRDPVMILDLENFMHIWAVPDFALATQSDPDFTVYKNGSSQVPEIFNVQAQTGFDSANISWDTDQPTNGQIWIKFDSGPVDWRVTTEAVGAKPIAAEVIQESLLNNHKMIISGLLPNSKYFFHISSTNEYGQSIVSDEQSFATQNGGSPSLQAKRYFRPLYRQVRCGWNANEGPITIVGLGFVILGALIIWRRRRLLVSK